MNGLGLILIGLSIIGLVVLAHKNDWFQVILYSIAGIWCMIIWPILKYPPIILSVLLFMLGAGVMLVII